MRADLHQHLWTDPLVEALRARRSPPQLIAPKAEQPGKLILTAFGELPSKLDLDTERPEQRAALLAADGIDVACVALSSPIGIEALPRAEAVELIDAHLIGVQAAGSKFSAWGPIALDEPDPEDVDRVLERGCVGISLPGDALAHPDRLSALAPILDRIAERHVPLFVHPGPAPWGSPVVPPSATPPWWTPMTAYVSQMQAAWLTFCAVGRAAHPELVVLFAMLAGGAPLLAERLSARGGPTVDLHDPWIFYDTSSFGSAAVEAMSQLVGAERLIYGSDRPVVEPVPNSGTSRLQDNAARLLSRSRERGL